MVLGQFIDELIEFDCDNFDVKFEPNGSMEKGVVAYTADVDQKILTIAIGTK